MSPTCSLVSAGNRFIARTAADTPPAAATAARSASPTLTNHAYVGTLTHDKKKKQQKGLYIKRLHQHGTSGYCDGPKLGYTAPFGTVAGITTHSSSRGSCKKETMARLRRLLHNPTDTSKLTAITIQASPLKRVYQLKLLTAGRSTAVSVRAETCWKYFAWLSDRDTSLDVLAPPMFEGRGHWTVALVPGAFFLQRGNDATPCCAGQCWGLKACHPNKEDAR